MVCTLQRQRASQRGARRPGSEQGAGQRGRARVGLRAALELHEGEAAGLLGGLVDGDVDVRDAAVLLEDAAQLPHVLVALRARRDALSWALAPLPFTRWWFAPLLAQQQGIAPAVHGAARARPCSAARQGNACALSWDIGTIIQLSFLAPLLAAEQGIVPAVHSAAPGRPCLWASPSGADAHRRQVGDEESARELGLKAAHGHVLRAQQLDLLLAPAAHAAAAAAAAPAVVLRAHGGLDLVQGALRALCVRREHELRDRVVLWRERLSI